MSSRPRRVARFRVLAPLALALASGSLLGRQEVRRERPSFARVLELVQVAASSDPGAARAFRDLQALADEFESAGFGLETLDRNVLIASSAALSYLARDPARAESLRDLCGALEEELDGRAEGDPDLALALVQGRIALAHVPASDPSGDPCDELRRALAEARAIAPADRRDLLGLEVARELRDVLRTRGRSAEATAVLEEALATFPDDLDLRPWLACGLADERRVEGAFERAWHWINEAESGLARKRAQDPQARVVDLERTLAGTRCQLELAWGLVDLAAQSLVRERAAVDAGADDDESRLDVLLNTAGVALASTQVGVMRRAARTLDDALADPDLFGDRPGYRSQLQARRAVLQGSIEEFERPETPQAAAWIDRALAEPTLDPLHRRFLELKAVGLAVRAGDLENASSRLARLGTETPSPEMAATHAAWRAAVALARDSDRAELEACSEALDRCYRTFLEQWRATPQRDAGLGYLAARDRGLLLGARLELFLRLTDDLEGAVDLLLPEQALGSLARRLEAPAGTVADVREHLLGPDQGLLLYLPGLHAVRLFCIDDERIQTCVIPWTFGRERGPRELDDLLAISPAALDAQERERQRVALARVAADLSQRLLPAEAQACLARWKGLYVVGSDLLGVPFEELPFGETTLGRARALAALPSIPAALALAARRPPRGPERDLLVVAAPRSKRTGLAPLEVTPADVEALCSGFDRPPVLEGPGATLAALVNEQEQHPARALYVLAHGVSDLGRENGAGLALTPGDGDPDGVLWADELLDATWSVPPLVVLFSCGAARGPRRAGDDGLAQLGGVLLARGARCVVLASGDVAQEAAIRLAGELGPGLARGLPVAEALRVARVALAGDARFDHPFYIGALRVQGLGLETLDGMASGR